MKYHDKEVNHQQLPLNNLHPPGTVVYKGENPPEPTKIEIITYNQSSFSRETIFPFHHVPDVNDQIKNLKDMMNKIQTSENTVNWIKIQGLGNLHAIEETCKAFQIHPLVLEDIFSTKQRTKLEDYQSYLFLVLHLFSFSKQQQDNQLEQVSIILGKNFVISIQEHRSAIFEPILDRISTPKGRIRSLNADYLVYSLVDLIIDFYFTTLNKFGMEIEEIEDLVLESPSPLILQKIYRLKRTVLDLRKIFWPLREVINKIQREDSVLLSQDLQIFLRDLYDHIFRLSDSLENYRDIIYGLFDIYLSSVSNKMNDIMKILTIISTIFIPLSFLAGFYGMNFQFMPELGFRFAYPILIIIMLFISGLMLYFFKKKDWI